MLYVSIAIVLLRHNKKKNVDTHHRGRVGLVTFGVLPREARPKESRLLREAMPERVGVSLVRARDPPEDPHPVPVQVQRETQDLPGRQTVLLVELLFGVQPALGGFEQDRPLDVDQAVVEIHARSPAEQADTRGAQTGGVEVVRGERGYRRVPGGERGGDHP